jgi:hypothetical protein
MEAQPPSRAALSERARAEAVKNFIEAPIAWIRWLNSVTSG